MLSSSSRGYDSPTVTALAVRALGPGRLSVLSLGSARGGDDNSGRPIAELLGVAQCLERERQEAAREAREVEWLASAAAAIRSPSSRTCWRAARWMGRGAAHRDARRHGLGPDGQASGCLRRGDPTGADLADFRRRVGFLHVPVPFIGALRDREIHAITVSDEMRRWSVGGDYDRPIARRVLQEAGVPSAMFARRKSAIATHFSRTTACSRPRRARRSGATWTPRTGPAARGGYG